MLSSNQVNARPSTDTGVDVPATRGAASVPALEPIGEAVGRVLGRRAAGGRITVTLAGGGVVVNRALSHFGSFTYDGDPKWFTGELTLTFQGLFTDLAFRGSCVGHHIGSGLAVIQSVGSFEPDGPMRLAGQIVVAEITVAAETTYEARFYRLVPAPSAQKVPGAQLRASGTRIAVQ
jgi:hypothetical protein